MTVTDFSKQLAALEPEWSQWDSELPDQTLHFRERGSFYGSSISSGERFHQTFSRFTNGLWVPPVYHAACSAIDGVLADHDVVEIESEVPVQGFGLRGQVDLFGKLDTGRPVVVELKTTLGEYALKPRPAEIIQLCTYAAMLELDNPLLLWLRVSLKSHCVSAFSLDESAALINCVHCHIPKNLAA